ncbi:glycogen/starch synthase [Vibrio lentus]|nr:glycogen/starch synthase [Vibrio lentus]
MYAEIYNAQITESVSRSLLLRVWISLPKLGFQPDIVHANDWHTQALSLSCLSLVIQQHDFLKTHAA